MPRKISRLIGCQGSAQFLTAVSVLRQRQQEAGRSQDDYRDTVVFYDLSVPVEQLGQFQKTLSRLASSCGVWESIQFLAPETLQPLHRSAFTDGLRRTRAAVCRLLGSAHDEIFLARNWQAGNELLANTYPTAERICYGDAIGVYFPEEYLRPPLTRKKALPPRWHHLSRLIFGGKSFETLPFHSGYLVAPALFGHDAPFPVSRKDPAIMRGLIRDLAAHLDLPPLELPQSQPAAFVLTSNFSESGAMAQTEEIAAYADFLRSTLTAAATIFLKPHPRDGSEKIEILRSELARSFSDIRVLSEDAFFHLPFEILLARLPGLESITLMTFSSSCLGPAYIFGLEPIVGFGPARVQAHFNESHQGYRLQHERDLQSALRFLLHDSAPSPVPQVS